MALTWLNILILVLDSVNVLVIILCMLIAIWKRNKQPLKSRGYLPFVTIVALGTISVSRIISNLGINDMLLCILEIFDVSPLTLLILLVSAIQSFRYLFFNNINKSKQHLMLYKLYEEKFKPEEVSEEKKEDESENFKKKQFLSAKFKIRFLTRVGSPYTALASLILHYIIWCFGVGLIWIIFAAVGETGCPLLLPIPFGLIKFWYVIHASIVCSMNVAVLIYDIVINSKYIVKCQWRRIFFDDDPFRFRNEYLRSLFIMGWMILTTSGNGALQMADYNEGSGSSTNDTLSASLFELNSFVIHTVLLWNNVIVLLIMTFIWERRGYTGFKQDYSSEVAQVLDNADLKAKFKSFAEKEWSVENVLCYEDMQKFNKLKSETEKKRLAEHIYKKYFQPNAVLDVNVTQTLRDSIRKNIDEGNMDSLFKEAISQITQNLTDTYSRFRKLPEVETYIKNLKVSQDILNKL